MALNVSVMHTLLLFSVVEVFNCPLSDDWQWKKKFALKALKNAGFGTKASEEKVNMCVCNVKIGNDVDDQLSYLHVNAKFNCSTKIPKQKCVHNSMIYFSVRCIFYFLWCDCNAL